MPDIPTDPDLDNSITPYVQPEGFLDSRTETLFRKVQMDTAAKYLLNIRVKGNAETRIKGLDLAEHWFFTEVQARAEIEGYVPSNLSLTEREIRERIQIGKTIWHEREKIFQAIVDQVCPGKDDYEREIGFFLGIKYDLVREAREELHHYKLRAHNPALETLQRQRDSRELMKETVVNDIGIFMSNTEVVEPGYWNSLAKQLHDSEKFGYVMRGLTCMCIRISSEMAKSAAIGERLSSEAIRDLIIETNPLFITDEGLDAVLEVDLKDSNLQTNFLAICRTIFAPSISKNEEVKWFEGELLTMLIDYYSQVLDKVDKWPLHRVQEAGEANMGLYWSMKRKLFNSFPVQIFGSATKIIMDFANPELLKTGIHIWKNGVKMAGYIFPAPQVLSALTSRSGKALNLDGSQLGKAQSASIAWRKYFMALKIPERMQSHLDKIAAVKAELGIEHLDVFNTQVLNQVIQERYYIPDKRTGLYKAHREFGKLQMMRAANRILKLGNSKSIDAFTPKEREELVVSAAKTLEERRKNSVRKFRGLEGKFLLNQSISNFVMAQIGEEVASEVSAYELLYAQTAEELRASDFSDSSSFFQKIAANLMGNRDFRDFIVRASKKNRSDSRRYIPTEEERAIEDAREAIATNDKERLLHIIKYELGRSLPAKRNTLALMRETVFSQDQLAKKIQELESKKDDLDAAAKFALDIKRQYDNVYAYPLLAYVDETKKYTVRQSTDLKWLIVKLKDLKVGSYPDVRFSHNLVPSVQPIIAEAKQELKALIESEPLGRYSKKYVEIRSLERKIKALEELLGISGNLLKHIPEDLIKPLTVRQLLSGLTFKSDYINLLSREGEIKEMATRFEDAADDPTGEKRRISALATKLRYRVNLFREAQQLYANAEDDLIKSMEKLGLALPKELLTPEQ